MRENKGIVLKDALADTITKVATKFSATFTSFETDSNKIPKNLTKEVEKIH